MLCTKIVIINHKICSTFTIIYNFIVENCERNLTYIKYYGKRKLIIIKLIINTLSLIFYSKKDTIYKIL